MITLTPPDSRLRKRRGMPLVFAGLLGCSSIVATTSCKENSSTIQSDTATSTATAPTATAPTATTPTATAPTASAAPTAHVDTTGKTDASPTAASNDAAAPGGDAGLAATGSAKSGSNVYPWEPAIVEIPGTLVRKPIQYSNGAVPVVVFEKPIRIETPPGETPDRSLNHVTEAWLSYNGISKDEVNKLVGKKVTYKGALNHMGTAHHLSDPWLDGTVTAR